MVFNYFQRPLTRDEIKTLAKAVHDEIYSIENTLKRRGYVYAGQGRIEDVILPHSHTDIDRFYQHMASRTFRGILKKILMKKSDIRQEDFANECNEAKLQEYLGFLQSTGILQKELEVSFSLGLDVDDFGYTLEWYVSELFKRKLSSTADWGVRVKDVAPGGDFDVLARVESTLVWVETKSARPQDIDETKIRHFLQRDQNLDPDMSIFLVDTRDKLSNLVQAFENIITPVVSPKRYASDPNYREKIRQLPDFGGIHFFLRRIFIINSQPSILAQLRNCLRYYFAMVPYFTYFSREGRLDFLACH